MGKALRFLGRWQRRFAAEATGSFHGGEHAEQHLSGEQRIVIAQCTFLHRASEEFGEAQRRLPRCVGIEGPGKIGKTDGLGDQCAVSSYAVIAQQPLAKCGAEAKQGLTYVGVVTVELNQDGRGATARNLAEKYILALEMIVDGLLGNARLGGNALDAATVAFFHEDFRCGIDEPLTTVGGVG